MLSDSERRQVYDRFGHEGLRGGGFQPGAGFGTIEDLLGAVFGGAFGFEVRRGPMRGQDLVHAVEISAVQAMLGATVTIPSHEGEREVELPPGVQHGPRSACAATDCPVPTAARRAICASSSTSSSRPTSPTSSASWPRSWRSRWSRTTCARSRRQRLLLAHAPGLRLIRLAVRCAPEQAEVVLAELTVLAPNGVEEETGPGYVEYAIYGGEGELPELGEIEVAAGDGLVEVVATEVPDDWADRWQDFHKPLLVGDRLWLRPSWEEPREGTIDLVVDPGRAFGTGAHPTTRLCLESCSS